MGKLLRILGVILAIAVGLVVVLAIVLPLVIDPNDYKDQIAGVVEKQTGRTLSINGDIDLSVFPWLGLDIGPTTLSNAPGFGSEPFASMERVQVRAKLLPLLKKQLEMDTVSVSGLNLNLAKDANGRTNWSDLQGGDTVDESTDKAPESTGTGSALAGLAIGGVQVTEARVVWDDRSADVRHEIDDLNITTGPLQPDEPFDLDLGFQYADAAGKMNGQFSLDGVVHVASSMQQFRIDGMDLGVDLQGEGIPNGEMKAGLKTDVALDLEQQTLSLPKLALEILDLQMNGDLAGSQLLGDSPQFTGAFVIEEFSPRKLIEALGQEVPVTMDPEVLAVAKASLRLDASTEQVAISDLKVKLDDTSIEGEAGVRDFSAPAIRFKMSADSLDADRYLPPPVEGEEPVAVPPTVAAAGGAGALPVDTLRSLNINGSVRLGKLKVFQLRSTDIEVQIKARDGLLQVNPLNASLYQGAYRGNMALDVRKDTPRIAIDERLTGVQAGPLLKDLTGSDTLTGNAEIQVKLSGSGEQAEQITRTLNGNATFSFTDGAIKGVNLAAIIREAMARIKGEPVPQMEGPNQTDFSEMGGSATVSNGLVKNDDLRIKTPLMRITGKGKVDLPAESVDYLVTANFVDSLEGQGGKDLRDLAGIAVPVRVGGTFGKLTYTPDLQAALEENAREEIEKETKKLQEKAEKKIMKKLDKLFQ